jgi:hypothetical protein
MRDAAFDEWIDEARGLRIERALDLVAPSHAISRRTRYVGPCPGCGGRDRFSLNLRKNIFWCRKAAEGGDAIALARHVTGLDFLAAVELLTGRSPPGRTVSEEEKAERQARVAELEQKRRRENARLAAEENEFRAREISRARDIWASAGPLSGSVAESYLRFRGVQPAPGAKIRACSALPYWHEVNGRWAVIHTGPAMVAAIQGRDLTFIGCHCTWIDGSFASRSGKAQIMHPETGEILDAKKVRGSQKGGHIHLGGSPNASSLMIGEGIETVYSVREAMIASGRFASAAWAFWSAVNLGNIGGRAEKSVPHPEETLTDKLGRVRRRLIPGPVPDLADENCLAPPEHVTDVLLLGDGDSDRATTSNVLQRFAGRWARPDRSIRAAWAEPGLDFSDMLMGAA